MAKEPIRIKVNPGSELAELLTRAEAIPIVLEKDGELYRLDRMTKEGKVSSPEEVTRSRAGILKAAGSWKDIDGVAAKTKADFEAFRAAAGSWKDVDTDKLIEDIYESRRRSSRPPVEL
jgi:hypothetical protein